MVIADSLYVRVNAHDNGAITRRLHGGLNKMETSDT